MTGPTSDLEVPAFWQRLGLPGLADVHVKFLPPRMMRRVWEQTTARPSIYKWSDEERIDHLRAMGVRAFTAFAYADQPGTAADLNAWTLDLAQRTPGCLPSATFFPEPGVNRYTRAAIDSGARIFQVQFQAADITPAHALLDAVWGVLAEAGIPVVVHPGSRSVDSVHSGHSGLARSGLGRSGLGRSGLGAIEAVLRRHPRLIAIVPHLGAPEYTGFLDLAERYDRVCLATSFGLTPFVDGQSPFPRSCRQRLHALGVHGKLVFGSDFPSLTHPYASQLSALADLGHGDAWLRSVCWDNAASLLQLS